MARPRDHALQGPDGRIGTPTPREAGVPVYCSAPHPCQRRTLSLALPSVRPSPPALLCAAHGRPLCSIAHMCTLSHSRSSLAPSPPRPFPVPARRPQERSACRCAAARSCHAIVARPLACSPPLAHPRPLRVALGRPPRPSARTCARARLRPLDVRVQPDPIPHAVSLLSLLVDGRILAPRDTDLKEPRPCPLVLCELGQSSGHAATVSNGTGKP